MSPEAARLCTNVGDVDMFAEHTTIFADFHIPNKISNIWTWPKPSPLDWDKIDVTKWHAQVAQQPPLVGEGLTSTQHFSVWAHRWESALDGCIKEQPEGKLPDRCKGRAQRVKPELVPPVPPVAKASRPGEVQLRSDLISTQVQLWFKQLRRLQSFKHAALANKLTLDAEAYRLNLWTATKRGRGFDSYLPHGGYAANGVPSMPLHYFLTFLLMAQLLKPSSMTSSTTLRCLKDGTCDSDANNCS